MRGEPRRRARPASGAAKWVRGAPGDTGTGLRRHRLFLFGADEREFVRRGSRSRTRLPSGNSPFKNLGRQRVLHLLLDHALQRPGAVHAGRSPAARSRRAPRRSLPAPGRSAPAACAAARSAGRRSCGSACRSSGWKMIVSSMRFRNSGRNCGLQRFVHRLANFLLGCRPRA